MWVCDCTLSHGLKCLSFFFLSFPLNSCAHNDSRKKEWMSGHAVMSRAVLWELGSARLRLPRGPIRRCQSTSAYISRWDCCISQTTGGTSLDFFFLLSLSDATQVKCGGSKRRAMPDALYVPRRSRHKMNCFYTFSIPPFDLCSQSVVRWQCISRVVVKHCVTALIEGVGGRVVEKRDVE